MTVSDASPFDLRQLSHTTEGQRSLSGTVPVGLPRLLLFALCLHRNSLQGPAAAFSATLKVLALHENRLSEVPAAPLTLTHPEALHILFEEMECPHLICLHRNRLSCKLPSIRGSSITLSLLALGNHFEYPEDGFTEWIQPHERSALFYIGRHDGKLFLLQLGVVACLAGSAVFIHLAHHSHTLLGSNGHSRTISCVTRLMRSTFRTCFVLTLFSCSLPLRLCFDFPYFKCPSFYVQLSSIFSSSGTAQIISIVPWTATSIAFSRCRAIDPKLPFHISKEHNSVTLKVTIPWSLG